MKPSSAFRIAIMVAGIFGIAWLAYLFTERGVNVSTHLDAESIADQAGAVDPVNSQATAGAGSNSSTLAGAVAPARKRAANSQSQADRETFSVEADGQSVLLRIALDEAIIRDSEGLESLVVLDPVASLETLPEHLTRLGEPGSVFPIAYVEGRPRSVATRRVITQDVRVQVGTLDAQAFAEPLGLTVKSRPSYAPEWAILAAADPFAAIAAMDDLRDLPEIASADILLGKQYSLRSMPNDTLINDQWHLSNSNSARTHVNIEDAWDYAGGNGARGLGVRIGIVDDGLETDHPDLVSNVDTINDKDWNGNDSDPSPGSLDDHGTSCAGNAAARGNNNLGVAGAAPEATLVGMRLIAASVTDAQEAEAMAYLNDIIEVKSNSWGPYDDGETLEAPGALTIAALESASINGRGGLGTIYMWAGGNGGDVDDNSNYDGYANSIYTIAIGATNSTGGRSYYSEPGANLVVCAPSSGYSDGITTVDRTGSDGYASGDYTDDFGGTSSATPTAAGIVALMLEVNPNLGWRDVQEILISSAYKFDPTDSDWVDNDAGFHFNHDFGAGLIDATAAVALASTWTNLGTQLSETFSQSGLSASIPNNSATGITRSFDLSASDLRVEHVTLQLDIDHTSRGNLEITLTSPSGMVSYLTETHDDSSNDYSNWTFSSVRNWGEASTGTWTLQIADLSSSGNSDGGTLSSAELTVYGTSRIPVNPGPVASITSPSDQQVFSTGATVSVVVSASDLDVNGDPGSVTSVELFANGQSVGSDTSAPYTFNWEPADGAYTLVAIATDSEDESTTTAPVSISVINQSPTISEAILNADGQVFTDESLEVILVTASDPEGATPTISYQWQVSVDGVSYVDASGATSALLSASATSSGELWRCAVTASDGNSSSAIFYTDAVNVLNAPITAAGIGEAYSHSSGLVLRGTETTLSRAAIINEFSQGPSGQAAEWIEILTLENTSLAYWDIEDANGNILVFLDDAVWDDIPAGTLIVIYNGADKDPLLPSDDGDPSDGVMIVSSTDTTYFDDSYDAWPSLNNSGDAIFLHDADAEEVHSLAYGSSSDTTPQIGSVGSGAAAYYMGGSDEGADIAGNWVTTISGSARVLKANNSRAVTFTNGQYSEDFNVTPGEGGTTYPLGWTAYNASVEDTLMNVGTSSSNSGANYNYGSQIGILGSGSNFNESSLVLTLQNTNGLSGLMISYDVNKIREMTRSHDCILEYSLSSATSGFIAVPGASYTSGTIAEGTVTSFNSIALPAALDNQAGSVYLRWHYTPSATPGGGSRDGLALDNVVITSSGVSGDPALSVVLAPSSVAENAGLAAVSGTVSLSESLDSDLIVSLLSSDTSEASVPVSVVIAAGNTSANFDVDAVDDSTQDGSQIVTITASATGYIDGVTNLSITDDEAPQEGVTPGVGNATANIEFIDALQNGLLNMPAFFRLSAGVDLPTGLSLDVNTGVLSGTIDPGAATGDYLIVIERFNSLDEVVSESFVFTVSGSESETFATWAAAYDLGLETGVDQDPDGDGLPNGIENLFGSAPDVADVGLTDVSSLSDALIFRHTLSNTPASDLSLSYQWSSDLVNWNASGETVGDITATIRTELLVDNEAPENDIVEVTTTVSGGDSIFVRVQVIEP